MAFKDVGAGIWSCVGYIVAGSLGLSLSMAPRISRLQIGKFKLLVPRYAGSIDYTEIGYIVTHQPAYRLQ